MFGNNSVTSSWANPQQNPQQPPQAPSAFGQSSAFGTTNAFGSGASTFGQPQQQQQSQTNPMFGNLGGSSSTAQPASGSGFGAFGSTNTSNTNPLFGGAKPATGFGTFGGGGTSTFGGGGAFGTNTSTTGTGSSLFGSNTNTGPSSFNGGGGGGGGGLFGSAKPATGFGSTTTTDGVVAPVTTGTSNPPYSVFSEKDAQNNTVTLQYQSITAMQAYRGSSFEELRLQDYQQGRKTAGAFGQSATFGTTPQPATSSIFGSTTQPQTQSTQPASSIFGGTGTFGTNTGSTGVFGGGTGAFGQPQNTTAGTGTGLLGGGTAFGQQQQQPQQPAHGFGNFGQPQQNQPSTGSSLFGNAAFGQNKPATGFGTFGTAPSNTITTGAGGFGTFGQPSQPPASTGLFGQNQQQQPANSTFGAFGTNNAAKPGGIFGSTAGTSQPGAGFGLFGGNNQQQQNQTQGTQPSNGLFGSGGGLFGNTTNQQQGQQGQQPQQSGGLFGNTQPQQQSSTGLFGGGGGLFGSTNQQQQQQQQQPAQQQNSFGLFGAPKPATTAPSGGLFGSSTFGTTGTTNTTQIQQPSLFGSTLGQPTQQQQNTGTGTFGSGGLFGNKPAASTLGSSTSQAPGSSLFGSTLGNSTSFTATASNAGAQGTLTASIAQPIGANLPIFSMLPPGPRAVTLEQPKKKPGFFVDLPTRSPVPRLQLGYTPASSTKLRGFASQAGSSSSTGNVLFTSGKPNALSLSKVVDNKGIGPDALLGRSGSPSLGSGGRQSVKKLILDKKVEPSDLFNRSKSPALKGTSSAKVSFSPALSMAAREKETTSSPPSAPSGHQPNGRTPPSGQSQKQSRYHAHIPEPEVLKTPGKEGSDELQEGDYWVKPDLDTLKNTGYEQLSSFQNLVVGRVGYGEIHFLDPVDLTGLPKLSALLGELVRFDDKECSVYPDVDDVDKPSPGSGLNVHARIILVRCWPLDKATREPIKDEKNPMAAKHAKRLRNMRDTHFESFDIKEGKWVFTVEHF